MLQDLIADDLLNIIVEYVIEDDIHVLLRINRKFHEIVINFIQRYYNHIRSNCYLLKSNNDLTIQDLLTYFIRFNRLKVLFIGGVHGYRRCDIYDPFKNIFKKSCGLHLKRDDEFDAIYHLGLVFVISGSDSASAGTVECYDASINQWIHQTSLPETLVALSIASYQDKLYVFGGFNRSENSRSSNIYILHSNQSTSADSIITDQDKNIIHPYEWKLSEISLLYKRSHHSSICYNNCIWIVGGFIDRYNYACKHVEIYNPQLKSITIGPSLNNSRYYPRLLILNNQLYCVGGDMDGTQSTMGSIEKYNIINNTWQIETIFPTKRNRCACFGLNDKIYLFGGSINEYTQKTWDSYNIITKSWFSSYHCNIFMDEINRPMKQLETFHGRNIGMQNTIAIPLQFTNY